MKSFYYAVNMKHISALQMMLLLFTFFNSTMADNSACDDTEDGTKSAPWINEGGFIILVFVLLLLLLFVICALSFACIVL